MAPTPLPLALSLGTGVTIAVLVVLALIVIGIYNSLVRKRMEVRAAWSQIDVQLKRRHDLIPNLVETVKGYAGHEKETLQRVIAARGAAVSAAGPAQSAAAENMLTGALRQLMALSEAYPDLKANQNFMQLSEELTTTENKISFARQHYNNCVGDFNQAIQVFPAVLIAGQLGFKTEEFYELEDQGAKEAPAVKFS
jgi:LemA protein